MFFENYHLDSKQNRQWLHFSLGPLKSPVSNAIKGLLRIRSIVELKFNDQRKVRN